MGVRATFKKRYITLAPVAGIVGLAFNLKVRRRPVACVLCVLACVRACVRAFVCVFVPPHPASWIPCLERWYPPLPPAPPPSFVPSPHFSFSRLYEYLCLCLGVTFGVSYRMAWLVVPSTSLFAALVRLAVPGTSPFCRSMSRWCFFRRGASSLPRGARYRGSWQMSHVAPLVFLAAVSARFQEPNVCASSFFFHCRPIIAVQGT